MNLAGCHRPRISQLSVTVCIRSAQVFWALRQELESALQAAEAAAMEKAGHLSEAGAAADALAGEVARLEGVLAAKEAGLASLREAAASAAAEADKKARAHGDFPDHPCKHCCRQWCTFALAADGHLRMALLVSHQRHLSFSGAPCNCSPGAACTQV
jgi:hypothetical protein